jgi:hypothetical protein
MENGMKRSLIVIASALAFVQLAGAGPLADQKQWEAVEKKIKDTEADIAKPNRCGGPVVGKIDKASFADDEAKKVGHYCAAALSGVGALCSLAANKDHKPAILKAVASVTCHYDASLQTGSSALHWGTKVVKSGTNVDVSFNSKSSNIESEVRDFLSKEL